VERGTEGDRLKEIIKMELKYDPIPFIFEKGDLYTKLSVLEMVDLWDNPLGDKLLLELLKTQNKDGGFPSQIDPEQSGVRKTERVAYLLSRCGMPREGLSLSGCMKFILKHQTGDGGFGENPKIDIPESLNWVSNQKGVTWLTVDIVDLLRLFGQENAKVCQKAINWLRRMELAGGGWGAVEGQETVDPDSSVMVTFLMKDLLGEEDTLYKRGREQYEKHLDQTATDAEQGYYILEERKEENDIYHLTHLLGQSFFSGKRAVDSGYDIRDRRIKRIVEGIAKIQREDGGFKPYWSQESDPLYTGLALNILLWVKAMKKEKIKSMVQKGVFSGK
jgi:prenyltransferase beta subunit